MNAIHHLPWWAQLLTGIVLIIGGVTAELINQRHLNGDSRTLTIAACLLGFAGILMLLTWRG